jgi:hypothetical protein
MTLISRVKGTKPSAMAGAPFSVASAASGARRLSDTRACPLPS